ncbi:MAG: hypothetical protein GC162_06570 [Planctomycetes bacterium]|nr:hypothetical protein [Planctomycetota bacterium]
MGLMHQRLVELESKIAYVEHTLDALNAIVIEQQARLELIEQQLHKLRRQIDSPAQTPRPEDEPPPPHY